MPERLIGNGIRYSEIHDPKFRSCLLTLQFYIPRDRMTAPVHALLPDLLTASSAAFPSVREMTLQLESLYAADFIAKTSLCGDAAVLEFTASWLDDAFALDGESVTAPMLELVTGALLHPNAENGAFCDPEFRICKQNLLDDIDCEQNDKRSYALRCAAELTFAGEPAAIPAHGTRPEAERITPEQAFAVWQGILRTAFIEIAAVTPNPRPEIETQLAAAFRTLERQPVPVIFDAPSPLHEPVCRETERMPLGQTKLVLTYKYNSIRREVLLMLCSILGWIADSLLFTNLRERCGLCYYCLLSNAAFKHTLFIDIGIDAANLEAVLSAADAQIRALQTGDFTDDMMQKAVLRYGFQAAAASDTISDLAMQRILSLRRGDLRSGQEIAAAMGKVTRAEIMDAAKQLRPDAVFVLRAEQEEAEPDDDD